MQEFDNKQYNGYKWQTALLDLSETMDGQPGYRMVLSGNIKADIKIKCNEWSHNFQPKKGYSVVVLLGYKDEGKSFVCEIWTGNLITNPSTPVILKDALYPYSDGHISPR